MEGWDDSFQGGEGVTTDILSRRLLSRFMMKKIMILGVESFAAWLDVKYLFSVVNNEQIKEDIQEWIAKEFEQEVTV